MSHRPESAAEWGKAAKFLVVGGVNTAATYAIYAGLVWLGAHYALALALEYAFGIAFGYWANRSWTFADRERLRADAPPDRAWIRELLKYVITYIGVFTANLALLAAMVDGLTMDAYVAQLAALFVVTVASYGVQRLWVFRNKGARGVRDD